MTRQNECRAIALLHDGKAFLRICFHIVILNLLEFLFVSLNPGHTGKAMPRHAGAVLSVKDFWEGVETLFAKKGFRACKSYALSFLH